MIEAAGRRRRISVEVAPFRVVRGRGSVSGYGRCVRSVMEFLVVALVVTLTPGPGTATILRVAARDGRRAAMSAVMGNSGGCENRRSDPLGLSAR